MSDSHRYDEWRLGQFIENGLGCLNEITARRLGASERWQYEGGKPFCLFQLDDAEAVKQRIRAAMECRSLENLETAMPAVVKPVSGDSR